MNALFLVALQKVSNEFSTLLTPASYALVLWSFIFIALFIFSAYLIISEQEDLLVESISGWFVAASILHTSWMILFVYRIMSYACFFLVMELYAVLGMSWILRRHSNPAIKFLFSLWAGYCLFNSILLETIFFTYCLDAKFFNTTTWASLALLLLGCAALLCTLALRSSGFAVAIAWTLVAIRIQDYGYVINLISVLLVNLLVTPLVLSLIKRKRCQQDKKDKKAQDVENNENTNEVVHNPTASFWKLFQHAQFINFPHFHYPQPIAIPHNYRVAAL